MFLEQVGYGQRWTDLDVHRSLPDSGGVPVLRGRLFGRHRFSAILTNLFSLGQQQRWCFLGT